MDTPGSFGEWLKKRRKVLDLTQEELAERAGCSVFALRKIEAGYRKPSKQLAGLLAAALEIPEQEQPLFIGVARGELNLDRLRFSKPEIKHASVSGLLSPPYVQESGSRQTEFGTTAQSLPVPLTPLLGRDSELAALERIFKDPQCRLLTLTGMGGIGKTRLAIEFASCYQHMFADGVYYVPLASINSMDLVAPAIADVVGFTFSGPMDLNDQLIRYMAMRMSHSALLVLDNLEHLIAQSSDTVSLVLKFLQRLPCVKILTTSRERLNLHGEWTYELHGLPVPPIDLASHLDEYSAAVLFIQSAQRTNIDFEISPAERNDLIRICRLVEGTPLAIELAAAWANILTCAEIANEIESNIDFLSTSMYDLPERHRSLRATFDHSWKLLSARERDVLSCLSVFRGGFDRQAAEDVSGATLGLLASLVSKSLVRRTETGRYDLHEVIRQYGMSHLDENAAHFIEIGDYHGAYYLKYVAERENALKSAAQQTAMRELTREMDNIRAAWVWGIQRVQFALLGTSIRSMGWMFEVAGLLDEGIEQLEQLIQALKSGAHRESFNEELGEALVHQALLYFRKGQFLHSRNLYQESIRILRSAGNPVLLADALIYSGIITHLFGDFKGAKELLQEGLGFARSANESWLIAYAIDNLGYIASQLGYYTEGYQQMMKGVEIWRSLGDPHSIALGLNFMVPTLIRLGRYEEAKANMYESIALCEQTRNRWGMGTAYRYLGLVLEQEGQYADAKSQFQKSLEIFSDYTEGWDIVRNLTYLGDVSLKMGDSAGAKKFYLEALPQAVHVQAMPIAIDALVGLAQLASQSKEFEQAFELLDIVLDHPSSTEEAKDHARELLGEVASLLTVESVHAIRERNSNQSLDLVADRLLSKSPS